jgi:hypothetical protein
MRECGCTIAQHGSAAQPAGAKRRVTPEDHLARIRALRNGRPLSNVLEEMRVQFLASDPGFRKVEGALIREVASFRTSTAGATTL